ncbi:MAG TPA: adenosylcobinamide-GDP ribazoletransferase [Rhodocyclaceae bacterium]|nr:adenosylcobinamide-GDP ribazoletransferase [Rhodocyclaceae bacterium]
MKLLVREIAAFFAAVRFFTRVPVPAWVGHSQDQLNHAARYFTLVGALVGAVGALTTELTALFLPASLAILLGMAATILMTGAFHEDGLADACDGFGGGWDKAQVLTIMKDSRIGSYGAIAVALALMIKFNALAEIDAVAPAPSLALILIAAHAASRLTPVLLMRWLDYAREDESAKSKPLAQSIDNRGLALAAFWGLTPCLLLSPELALGALVGVALTALLCARYFKRRIGGYTGDCLGASQQLSELAFYLFGIACASI